MTKEIGSYEAKSKLPEFLRRVRAGEKFVITHHGKPIAELTPPAAALRRSAASAVELMLAFPRMKGVKGDDVKAMISQGRR
jgi:prevent-host-death family protein